MGRNVYNMIEEHYKSSILPTAVNLQTTDGLPMSSMGKATLYLWIADFKFSHSSVICDRLPETDFPFYQPTKMILFYCWDLDRHLFIPRSSFLTYSRNREDVCNIALVKSTLKISPRHIVAVPIKIKGHNL